MQYALLKFKLRSGMQPRFANVKIYNLQGSWVFFLNCLTIYTLIYIIIAAILLTDKFSIGTEQQQNFVL